MGSSHFSPCPPAFLCYPPLLLRVSCILLIYSSSQDLFLSARIPPPPPQTNVKIEILALYLLGNAQCLFSRVWVASPSIILSSMVCALKIQRSSHWRGTCSCKEHLFVIDSFLNMCGFLQNTANWLITKQNFWQLQNLENWSRCLHLMLCRGSLLPWQSLLAEPSQYLRDKQAPSASVTGVSPWMVPCPSDLP